MPGNRAGLPAVLAALAACVACDSVRTTGRAESPEPILRARADRGRRDVVLVTIDTLRYDATGFSGAGKAATPSFDRLAARGVVFTQARSHAVLTLPSHASILTGLYPFEHGVRDNTGFFLDPATPTLATELRRAGYATAAFVSAFTLDRRFGLATGFDVYDDDCEGAPSNGLTPPERAGSETVRRALAWWDAHPGGRRFLWVHLYTPHFPYEPPEPFATRYRANPYYGEAAAADRELAPLVERLLGSPGGSVVVFTSDHGEGLGEHQEATHGLFAYDATLHVPLVLVDDGVLAPGTVARPVRHVDLVPTILDLVGLTAPPRVTGRSLLEARRPQDGRGYFEAMGPYFERGWAPLSGVVEGGLKAIRLPIPELYDLEADPAEVHDLSGTRSTTLRSMIAGLPEGVGRAERGPLDAEAEARLRSLGYVAGGNPPADASDPALDPKRLVHVDRDIERSLTLYRAGDHDGALAVMRSVVAEQPSMLLGRTQLATMLTELGRLDEAVSVLAEAARLGIADEGALRKLALLMMRGGHPQQARAVLAPYAESRDPDTQSALGRAAAAAGDTAEARARFERVLQANPESGTGLMDLGILLLQEGKIAEASALLERSVSRNPGLGDAWNALGAARMRGGDLRGASDAWEKAVDVDPRNPDALYNLAVVREKRGDPRGAAAALERYVPLVGAAEAAAAREWLSRLGAAAAR